MKSLGDLEEFGKYRKKKIKELLKGIKRCIFYKKMKSTGEGIVIQLAYKINEQRVALQWVYSGSTTNKRRTMNEQKTNNERRKSVGKLVLSRRILERVRQVSSIFYAFKLTF